VNNNENKKTVIPPAVELLAERNGGQPIWVRAPRGGGPCPWSGLSRSTLYALASEGRIRTASIRAPGSLRGVRLFHLPSIMALIEASEEVKP
jgi:hypothetical protein